MKHIRRIFESTDISKVEDAADFLRDEVDSLKITEQQWLGNTMFNIEISYRESLGMNNKDISNVWENSEKLRKINKEYFDFLQKLIDMGFSVEYHLMENQHHLNYFKFTAKVQTIPPSLPTSSSPPVSI